MTRTDIRDVLSRQIADGSDVVIAGWLRSVRTSKGGFAFLSVNDGSSFDGLQVVADAALPNYETEIVKLTTGCAVEVEGTVVASQGKNQEREIQATRVTLIGAVDDPETYPIAKKRHTFEYLRTVAHLRPRTNTFGAIARRAQLDHAGRARLLSPPRLRVGQHADHHCERLRRCGPAVSRQHARCAQSAAHGERASTSNRTSSVGRRI